MVNEKCFYSSHQHVKEMAEQYHSEGKIGARVRDALIQYKIDD